MSAATAEKKRAPFWAGFVATLPVAAGCAPFGVAYGAAAAATLPLWQTSLMSVAVFAGTAQFIAASMLAQGSTWLPVLVTCALVNLRLVLLSAAISPNVRGAGIIRRALAAQMLTDESFAVSMAGYRKGERGPAYLIGSGLSLFLIWQAATVVGRVAGEFVPQGLGLEYALPASLICLLFLLVRNKRQWAVAALAVGLVLVGRNVLPTAWVTPVATVMAASIGLGARRWR